MQKQNKAEELSCWVGADTHTLTHSLFGAEVAPNSQLISLDHGTV